MSNVDETVLSEDKVILGPQIPPKLGNFPDNALNKENLEETIRLSREFPKALSDNASKRMVENEDAICNPKHVQDAFVFCPMLNSIEMDSIMAQGIFLSEKEMSQMEERKHSIFYKFSDITFEEKVSAKSKMQATEDVLNNMEINNNEEEFYATINVTGIFSFEKDTPIDN